MRRRSATLAALAAYCLLALAFTWPLARGLTHDLPADLGDPLLNTWIVTHDARIFARALAGHAGALREYWNPPIFFPHPLALAYSEHLTPQALQLFPAYLVSHNPILCYNLLFLSTFALSALGMFLLVRELTDNLAAAFLAGLAFGFAPYRIASMSHVQVLSSAWMPFTLFGFRRFFATRRTVPLAGGTLGWIAQNLSCGYYLLFFSPIVALYLAWELTMRRLWSEGRLLARVAAAIAAMVVITLPFLLPYLHLRQLGFLPRSLDETLKFSADVYGYFTADVHVHVWGSIARAWPAPEGSLFPGLTVVVLAGVAIAGAWRRAWREAAGAPSAWTRALAWLLAAGAAMAMALVLGWSLRVPASRPIIKIANLDRELAALALVATALLAASCSARSTVRRFCASPVAFFLVITLLAAAMSFGPVIYARGRIVEDGTLYAALLRHVPGFDGLRVPARFGMIVVFGLAALAGCGAAALDRTRMRWCVPAACVLILLEGCAVPIPINVSDTDYRQAHLAALPGALAPRDAPLPVYAFAAQLPASSVLIELPLGEPAFDVRDMFYALGHGRALVNGYSGGAPAAYQLLAEALADFDAHQDRAWQAVVGSSATHVIVHEAQYEPGRGPRISRWLDAEGAREIASFDSDRVFALK